MQGKRVRYVPGWDCHGLPIELKVLQSMDADSAKGTHPDQAPQEGARVRAQDGGRAARDSFKRYGVWGDWEDPVPHPPPGVRGCADGGVRQDVPQRPRVPRQEARALVAQRRMTALAEAELEYPEGHVSQSVYVAFPIADASASDRATNSRRSIGRLTTASLAVWTTTPWTMPANAAVAVNDQLDYALVEVVSWERFEADPTREDGSSAAWWARRWWWRRAWCRGAAKKGAWRSRRCAPVKGAALEGITYAHPMYDRALARGGRRRLHHHRVRHRLVHTAPGHGQEDYLTGLKHGLPLFSPVDDEGDFTAEAGRRSSGKNGARRRQRGVHREASESDALMLQEAYGHKYPYDWRTKKPTIFRATSQWFASVEGFPGRRARGARRRSSSSPRRARSACGPMVSGRNDWCISRQRAGACPSRASTTRRRKEPLMDEATIAHVTEIVRTKGTDAWWELDIADLLPEQYKDKAATLVKGTDTMDVWFDSGSSWAGVVKRAVSSTPRTCTSRGIRPAPRLVPIVAPHGRRRGGGRAVQDHPHARVRAGREGVQDVQELGNVVDPRLVIEGGKNQKQEPAYGADTLRLWVASTDYTSDVLIGPGTLKQTSDAYRKLRGTVRFLMGNVNDFDPPRTPCRTTNSRRSTGTSSARRRTPSTRLETRTRRTRTPPP